MNNLITFAEKLVQHPHIAGKLSLQQFLLFIDHCCQLRPLLEVYDRLPHETLLPLELNDNVSLFLSRSLTQPGNSVDIETISATWKAFSPLIWNMPDRQTSVNTLIPIFLEHGTPLGIGEICGDHFSVDLMAW